MKAPDLKICDSIRHKDPYKGEGEKMVVKFDYQNAKIHVITALSTKYPQLNGVCQHVPFSTIWESFCHLNGAEIGVKEVEAPPPRKSKARKCQGGCPPIDVNAPCSPPSNATQVDLLGITVGVYQYEKERPEEEKAPYIKMSFGLFFLVVGAILGIILICYKMYLNYMATNAQ